MLYGRAGEQASVDALLAAARRGRSGVLVLRGEPGIGKSALLEYAAERAEGFRVIRATGVEYEADLPFAGLQLLLSPALERLPVLPAPQRRALEAAFGLAEGGGLTERLLSALGTLGLLAELAAETPLLCLVDDAQWLDRSSADALLLTARRLDREGVVLLFAARDGEGEFSAPGLPELRLEPLDPSAAAELLAARAQTADGSAADAGLRYRVLAEARGNPLALTELPAAAAAGPVGSEGPVPLTGRLREAFLGQVARLPAPTRTLLLVAAAEEQGELAIVLRAAEGLGAGAADLPPAEQAGLLRRTRGTADWHCGIRCYAPRSSKSPGWKRSWLSIGCWGRCCWRTARRIAVVGTWRWPPPVRTPSCPPRWSGPAIGPPTGPATPGRRRPSSGPPGWPRTGRARPAA